MSATTESANCVMEDNIAAELRRVNTFPSSSKRSKEMTTDEIPQLLPLPDYPGCGTVWSTCLYAEALSLAVAMTDTTSSPVKSMASHAILSADIDRICANYSSMNMITKSAQPFCLVDATTTSLDGGSEEDDIGIPSSLASEQCPSTGVASTQSPNNYMRDRLALRSPCAMALLDEDDVVLSETECTQLDLAVRQPREPIGISPTADLSVQRLCESTASSPTAEPSSVDEKMTVTVPMLTTPENVVLSSSSIVTDEEQQKKKHTSEPLVVVSPVMEVVGLSGASSPALYKAVASASDLISTALHSEQDAIIVSSAAMRDDIAALSAYGRGLLVACDETEAVLGAHKHMLLPFDPTLTSIVMTPNLIFPRPQLSVLVKQMSLDDARITKDICGLSLNNDIFTPLQSALDAANLQMTVLLFPPDHFLASQRQEVNFVVADAQQQQHHALFDTISINGSLSTPCSPLSPIRLKPDHFAAIPLPSNSHDHQQQRQQDNVLVEITTANRLPTTSASMLAATVAANHKIIPTSVEEADITPAANAYELLQPAVDDFLLLQSGLMIKEPADSVNAMPAAQSVCDSTKGATTIANSIMGDALVGTVPTGFAHGNSVLCPISQRMSDNVEFIGEMSSLTDAVAMTMSDERLGRIDIAVDESTAIILDSLYAIGSNVEYKRYATTFNSLSIGWARVFLIVDVDTTDMR